MVKISETTKLCQQFNFRVWAEEVIRAAEKQGLNASEVLKLRQEAIRIEEETRIWERKMRAIFI